MMLLFQIIIKNIKFSIIFKNNLYFINLDIIIGHEFLHLHQSELTQLHNLNSFKL